MPTSAAPPPGPDWAARRAARDAARAAGLPAGGSRIAAWAADPDAADRRTHPDDPDGEIARASAVAARIAMSRRAAGGWRRVRRAW